MGLFDTLFASASYKPDKHFLKQTMFGGAQQFGGAKSAEQISQIDANIKAGNTAEAITGTESGTKVYFDSPDGTASAHLSDQMMQRLSSHFTYDNFHKREDGSIILSGEAEKFVSGWYNEVAYAVGFLAANPDGKKELDEHQIMGLKAATFLDHKSQNIKKLQVSNDKYGTLVSWSQHLKDHANIDTAMDIRMLLDRDYDGAISVKEYFGNITRIAGLSDNDENIGKMMATLANEELQKAIRYQNKKEEEERHISGTKDSNDGGESAEDKKKKRELEIAEANGALPKIQAKIEQNGANSIDKVDKKHLDLLHLDAKSLEADLKRKNERLEQMAEALHVDKEHLRKQPADEGVDKEFKALGSELDEAKAAEFASLGAQLSGELLESFSMDKMV